MRDQDKILENVVLLPLNVLNKNGRIYTDEAATKIIETFKAKKNIVFGELGFPETMDVTLSNVSHTIENVRVQGNQIMGTIKILNTPSSDILAKSLNHYVFRPSSSGNIDPKTKEVKITKFFTFDAIRREADAFPFGDEELI